MMDIAVPSSWRLYFALPIALVLLLLAATASGQTQRKYPGRGAVSAQDLSRLTSPAAVGTTAADSGLRKVHDGFDDLGSARAPKPERRA